jgi:photosystem II stability/assembly factor-like uncharacterized protein
MSARQDADVVIAGVALQGLWVSQNGSKTWARLGQATGSAAITNRPSSLTYDPVDPKAFWESGIYNGGGAYKTTDNGQTFKQLGNLTHTDFVSVDLSDPARRTLLSGRHETSQLFRSGDGGATWVDITGALPSGVGYTSWPLVLNANLHLLGTTSASTAGVFRTTNGGAAWSRVYSGAVSGPALVAKSDGAIYWLLDQGQGVIKSTDQGLTWHIMRAVGQISTSAANLIELPDGRLATFGASVIVSANHGVTWQNVGAPLPYRPAGIIYAPIRKAFYAWRFDCAKTAQEDPSIKPDMIVRMDFDYHAH